MNLPGMCTAHCCSSLAFCLSFVIRVLGGAQHWSWEEPDASCLLIVNNHKAELKENMKSRWGWFQEGISVGRSLAGGELVSSRVPFHWQGNVPCPTASCMLPCLSWRRDCFHDRCTQQESRHCSGAMLDVGWDKPCQVRESRLSRKDRQQCPGRRWSRACQWSGCWGGKRSLCPGTAQGLSQLKMEQSRLESNVNKNSWGES